MLSLIEVIGFVPDAKPATTNIELKEMELMLTATWISCLLNLNTKSYQDIEEPQEPT